MEILMTIHTIFVNTLNVSLYKYFLAFPNSHLENIMSVPMSVLLRSTGDGDSEYWAIE
jgi:hypothetical protein